jgi:PKD repeat protein
MNFFLKLTIIAVGIVMMLTACKDSNATNFEWNFGDGTSSNLQNPTHQYTLAGAYNIQLIASKCGLNDSILQTISISNPTKIDGLKSKNTFNIIPNPAKSFLTISKEIQTYIPILYRILNLSGQEIDAGVLNHSSQYIDISKFLEGVYMIELFNNQQSFGRQKFVKMDD